MPKSFLCSAPGNLKYCLIQNEGTTPYPVSVIRVVESICSTSTSVLFANRPLILGLVSAYAFLEAYRIVFSNLRVFFFSLYLRTLASLSIGVSCCGIWSGALQKRSMVPLGGLWWEIETSLNIESGTTPTSMDEIETWNYNSNHHHRISWSIFLYQDFIYFFFFIQNIIKYFFPNRYSSLTSLIIVKN